MIVLKMIVESDLSSNSKLILLFFYFNCDLEKSYSVSLKDACKRLGISKPTFILSVRELKLKRYIKIKSSKTKNKSNNINSYIIL